MTDGTVHPSFLELDRHCVGVEVEAGTVLHLNECDRCRHYVEGYRPLTEVPAWVMGMSVPRSRARGRASTQRPPLLARVPEGMLRLQAKTPRAGVWAVGVLAAAAICLALWWPHGQRNTYDGVKGAPSVGVHVQRAGVASLWDGTPLSAGDRIRLEVMPEEFDHVSVFALGQEEGEPPLRLYSGRVMPKVSAVLPKAWQLDDAEGPEQLLVILAKSEVSAPAALGLMRAHDPAEILDRTLALAEATRGTMKDALLRSRTRGPASTIPRIAGLLLVLMICFRGSPALAEPPSPRRVALVIGANAAAPGRKDLRYSQRDAEAVGRVLVELGGFAREDVKMLLDPEPQQVLAALDLQLDRVRASGQEVLLFFYYSGHADANALYPKGRSLALSDLRARMGDPRVSVRIGVIDACRGGGWTGTKGLSETAPFEVDLPSALSSEGSVLIASSSGLEDAHESELLGGSFFTHHLIAGLRGAADRNTDGLVMLTEAFEYARALTIRDTALYTVSPQHPSFAMQLRGRHDLALSTLAGASAVIAVDQQDGPLELVHLGSGVVVLELPKGPRSLRLAVGPGRYVLRRRSGGQVWASEIELKSGQTVTIDEAHLTLVGSLALATKGAAPRPLTLTTVPKGMQEITGWLGITHGSQLGLMVATDDDFEFGMIAPRGLTDRLQWMLPTLAFAYRGGEHGGFEWIPSGGMLGWGLGYDSLTGLILQAQLGLGFDLRYWVSPRSSVDLGFGASSGLRWTQHDPDSFVTIPQHDSLEPTADSISSSTQTDTPRWIPPTTWRSTLSLGYTYTLSDVVTFHIALAVSQNHFVAGDFVKPSWSGQDAALAIGVGGVQSIGLRSLPLVRIHVRDWFALNLDAAWRFMPSRQVAEDSYLAGASFIW